MKVVNTIKFDGTVTVELVKDEGERVTVTESNSKYYCAKKGDALAKMIGCETEYRQEVLVSTQIDASEFFK